MAFESFFRKRVGFVRKRVGFVRESGWLSDLFGNVDGGSPNAALLAQCFTTLNGVLPAQCFTSLNGVLLA
ncbi:MAG: hypothetical protein IKF07_08135 [Eubacterium sp.]|nr:hypothetical protein [Eubacterium sp.]